MTKNLHTYLIIIALLLSSVLGSCSIAPYQKEGEQLYLGIKNIKYLDKDKSPHSEYALEAMEGQIAYAPNNSIFGSSRYRWPWNSWRTWLYETTLQDSTKLGKWLHKIGKKPVWIKDVSPTLRAQVAQTTLQEYGYFQASVHSILHPIGKDALKARVSYSISMGKPYQIDSISYLPPISLGDTLYYDHKTESKVKAGQPFNLHELNSDRDRVRNSLRNAGYYYFRSEYINYEADSLQRSGHICLRSSLKAGIPEAAKRQWRIGKIGIHILKERADGTLVQPTDSIELAPGIELSYVDNPKVRPRLLNKYLTLRPDSLYRYSKEEQILRSLSNLGALAGIELLFTPRKDSIQDSTATSAFTRGISTGGQSPLLGIQDTTGTLDLELLLRPDKPWSATLESQVTHKTTNFLGPGLKLSLERRNLFGAGETLAIAGYGSYEWETNSHIDSDGISTRINSYQLGGELGFSFPWILLPLKKNYYGDNVSTDLKFSIQQTRRAHFYTLSSLGVNLSYTLHKHARHLHRITPINLNYTKLQNISSSFSDILRNNPSLGLSMQSQFVPQISYTYTYQDDSGGRIGSGSWGLMTGISEAGNILSLSNRIMGHKFSDTKRVFGVPYSQFIKVYTEGKYTYQMARYSTLVSRIFLGAIYSYGNLQRAPYSEQFYVGGANSLRAFTVRSIGPGRFVGTDNTSAYSFFDHVGEAKLEANVEYRNQFSGLLGFALFVDAGNIWLLRPDNNRSGAAVGQIRSVGDFLNQIAINTGAGIRLDFDYLVLRLDVGVGLHLPHSTSRSGWYNIPRFSDALGIHLAIGYPF